MKSILIGYLVLALVTSAQAGLFEDLKNILTPIQTPATAQPADGFNAFMTRMYTLNTPKAIQSLNAEMDDYSVRTIKVSISGIPGESGTKRFFVARDLGVVTEAQNYDREVVLTYSQVMRMYPYFQDGKIDFFDRWQLYRIWKGKRSI